jgi:hypothetical protein
LIQTNTTDINKVHRTNTSWSSQTKAGCSNKKLGLYDLISIFLFLASNHFVKTRRLQQDVMQM